LWLLAVAEVQHNTVVAEVLVDLEPVHYLQRPEHLYQLQLATVVLVL
jgi:hypothetical protein